MRVALAGVGSRGDVQPLFALAQALRSAGHEPVLTAPPDFGAWAAGLGIPFIASGHSIEEAMQKHADAMGANPVRLLRTVEDLIVREVPAWFESALQAAQGADAIVFAAQFAAVSIAELLRIPCAGVVYSPTFLRSRHHPPIAVPWQRMPRWANSIAWVLNDAFIEHILRKATNQARARLGLAPLKSVIENYFRSGPYFLAADPVIATVPPDWQRFDITATGPWFYEDPAPLDPEVDAFLRAGPPPVYIGFGSMVAKDAARVTRAVIDGTRGRRLLLSRGWAGLGKDESRDDMMVVHGPMPHAKLFPRVAAVVHHGGSGTMATALRAGVPQVIVPHIMDQYYWGYRLEQLAIAPAPVPIARLDAAPLARALDAALRLPEAPRREAAARLAAGDGTKRAVTFLEGLVGR